jgi:hypothetical protein
MPTPAEALPLARQRFAKEWTLKRAKLVCPKIASTDT